VRDIGDFLPFMHQQVPGPVNPVKVPFYPLTGQFQFGGKILWHAEGFPEAEDPEAQEGMTCHELLQVLRRWMAFGAGEGKQEPLGWQAPFLNRKACTQGTAGHGAKLVQAFCRVAQDLPGSPPGNRWRNSLANACDDRLSGIHRREAFECGPEIGQFHP